MTNIQGEASVEEQDDNKRVIKINFKKINKVFFALIIVAFIAQLTGVNSLSIKGFILKDLKTQYNTLARDNRTLEVQTATLKSYESLSTRAEEINLVVSNDLEYIKTGDSLVAKR